MRGTYLKSYLANGMFAVCQRYMESVIDVANSANIETLFTDTAVTPSHSIEKINNVAVINVDGAMTKRNNAINAMCGGFPSYDILTKYMKDAEADSTIDTVIFHVDTVGGEVAGVDDLGELIYNSSKNTITLYTNIGASAGLWAFSASKKRYATVTTQVGSIGVMAGYSDRSDDGERVVLVSKNAKNKNCSLNGDCATKIQSRIDHVEGIFYDRLMRNTGLSAETLRDGFGEGDVISASRAVEIGFLDGIVTLDGLLATVVVPTASDNSDKSTQKFTEGVAMTFNRDDLDATEANFNLLVESRAHLNANIEKANAMIKDGVVALEKKTEEVEALSAKVSTLEGKLSEATSKDDVVSRIREAQSYGVDFDTIIKAVEAETNEQATAIIIDAKETGGFTAQTSTEPVKSSWEHISF